MYKTNLLSQIVLGQKAASTVCLFLYLDLQPLNSQEAVIQQACLGNK